jgi:hypothetical protein
MRLRLGNYRNFLSEIVLQNALNNPSPPAPQTNLQGQKTPFSYLTDSISLKKPVEELKAQVEPNIDCSSPFKLHRIH